MIGGGTYACQNLILLPTDINVLIVSRSTTKRWSATLAHFVCSLVFPTFRYFYFYAFDCVKGYDKAQWGNDKVGKTRCLMIGLHFGDWKQNLR